MESRLDRLTSSGYAEALSLRPQLAEIALAERNSAARRPDAGHASVGDYVASLAPRTVCLTLLAGSGSRWVKSLAAAQARGEWAGFDSARPRGLYPVRNFLRGSGCIPIAAYALSAVHGLGRHLIVVRGWQKEIDSEILARLGIDPGERDFFTQQAPFGKPLGHGDAAWQCRDVLRGADYVIANFGGDANSRRTVLSSLLVLDALRSTGKEVDFLLPAAPIESPAYPIGLDSEGLPRSFGHAKLQGKAQQRRAEDKAPASAEDRVPAKGGLGYTNVGVRVYSAPALVERLERFRERYWIEGTGYAIPGNDPEGHEFALDNVDAELASEGKARVLAIARPEELTPAKSVDDIPAFERAMQSVIAENAAIASP
jgi:hypothetical protein